MERWCGSWRIQLGAGSRSAADGYIFLSRHRPVVVILFGYVFLSRVGIFSSFVFRRRVPGHYDVGVCRSSISGTVFLVVWCRRLHAPRSRRPSSASATPLSEPRLEDIRPCWVRQSFRRFPGWNIYSFALYNITLSWLHIHDYRIQCIWIIIQLFNSQLVPWWTWNLRNVLRAELISDHNFR